MNKPTLLFNFSDHTSWSSTHVQTVLGNYFNLTFYEDNKVYDKASTIIVTNCLNSTNRWYDKFYHDGYAVVVDGTWEFLNRYKHNFINYPNVLLHSIEKWFWYHDALYFISQGYNKYVPNKKIVKKALMPLGRIKPIRDVIIAHLSDCLPEMIYSYHGKQVYLPNDIIYDTGYNWMRYINPDWYNSTNFSLVIETEVDFTEANDVFVTEKTLKPLAFCHPILVIGQPGTLKKLNEFGFETFSEQFDESYDNTSDLLQRMNIVIDNFNTFEKVFSVTEEKINYNHNRFYNIDLITDGIYRDLVAPILNYAETKH